MHEKGKVHVVQGPRKRTCFAGNRENDWLCRDQGNGIVLQEQGKWLVVQGPRKWGCFAENRENDLLCRDQKKGPVVQGQRPVKQGPGKMTCWAGTREKNLLCRDQGRGPVLQGTGWTVCWEWTRAELSEQAGDRRSSAGYFTSHRQLLFPDVRYRYKKSDKLAILSNDAGVTSGSSLFTAVYFFGVTVYFKTFWKPCIYIIPDFNAGKHSHTIFYL